MKKKSWAAIEAIARIRARNNLLWMALLALAVESAPQKAKAILRKIQANDKKVTKWTGRI